VIYVTLDPPAWRGKKKIAAQAIEPGLLVRHPISEEADRYPAGRRGLWRLGTNSQNPRCRPSYFPNGEHHTLVFWRADKKNPLAHIGFLFCFFVAGVGPADLDRVIGRLTAKKEGLFSTCAANHLARERAWRPCLSFRGWQGNKSWSKTWP